jgi:hypothetical protein
MTVSGSPAEGLRWRKSKYSTGNGECVEVASAQGRVSIRDSKDPGGPVLSYSVAAFRSFLGEAHEEVTSR